LRNPYNILAEILQVKNCFGDLWVRKG